MKIYFKNNIEGIYQKKGLLTAIFDNRVIKNEDKNIKKTLKILNTFKNKALKGFNKKEVNTKKFKKNIIFYMNNLDYKKIDINDYINLINSLYDLKTDSKNELIEVFLQGLLIDFEEEMYESIDIEKHFDKLKELIKLCIKHEKKYSHDYNENISLFLFMSANFNINYFRLNLYENIVLDILKNDKYSAQTLLNLSYEILNLLNEDIIILMLNNTKYPESKSMFIYRLLNERLNNENYELKNSIINNFKQNKKLLTELYYVCLIRNIDNNIKLSDINIKSVINILINTKNKLYKLSTENIEYLFKEYLLESKNTNDYLKRISDIEKYY